MENKIKQEARDEMQKRLRNLFKKLPEHPLMEIVMNEFVIVKKEKEIITK